MDKLIEELRKTSRPDYKWLAQKIKENSKKKDPTEARKIKIECTKILIDELEKYENDELINQLLLFVGKKVEPEEKANRK